MLAHRRLVLCRLFKNKKNKNKTVKKKNKKKEAQRRLVRGVHKLRSVALEEGVG
jgi:hypothetical protein